MRVLIVAATEFEIAGLRVKCNDPLSADRSLLPTDQSPLTPHHPPLSVYFLVTGVGMVATAFAMGHHLAKNNYDLAINLGIAGSFDRKIALGEVVEVTTDTIAELGAEDDDVFISIETLGFGESRFEASASLANFFKGDYTRLKKATAITVNTVHGNEASIAAIIERIKPQIESMEGAAFFYACKQHSLPCLQIRAVSNYVEKRNRDNWQIGLAIKNLNSFAVGLINKLRKKE